MTLLLFFFFFVVDFCFVFVLVVVVFFGVFFLVGLLCSYPVVEELFNFLCVCFYVFLFYVFESCFRTLAVILVSDFLWLPSWAFDNQTNTGTVSKATFGKLL